jgi:hypothetical protein
MRPIGTILLLLVTTLLPAQIPVEIFAGQDRTTVDIMFFKFFKDKAGHATPWLFFNRNRASVDYRMTEIAFLPQFGFTEAVSYNHKALKGFAPVLVGQVLSWGVYPKAGIQYAHITRDITVFTWLVTETLRDPALDYFLLFRYTPHITEKTSLFFQAESVNAFPTAEGVMSFTQRVRLGLQIRTYQFGLGVDFTQTGKGTFTNTFNAGGFIRHEF